MKKILTLSLFVFLGVFTFAQESIVTWKIDQSIEDTGAHIMTISAEIPHDWYIYGINMDEGGPLPLYMGIEDADNKVSAYSFIEISKPKEMYDDVFGMTVNSYFEKVEIKCKFVPKTDITEINLIIDGQACNKKDGSCVQVYETIPVELIEINK
ncbi:MAG: hypothetical protein C0596_15880 [Marinilabiliales bacterium]|nr:MAG: hypothetical protein C0596_15880 [Marinilabiliales bacterium]